MSVGKKMTNKVSLICQWLDSRETAKVSFYSLFKGIIHQKKYIFCHRSLTFVSLQTCIAFCLPHKKMLSRMFTHEMKAYSDQGMLCSKKDEKHCKNRSHDYISHFVKPCVRIRMKKSLSTENLPF